MSYTKKSLNKNKDINEIHPSGFIRKEEADANANALKSTLKFLSFPAVFMAITILLEIKLPTIVLYGFAGVLGIALFIHSLRDSEWALALFIIYMPLSKVIVVPIAPGINGTNLFILLLLFIWMFFNASKRTMSNAYPNSRIVKWFAILSCFSVVTLIFSDGGLSYLLENVLEEYKGWVDQFIIFYLYLTLIRDGAMAKRMVIYLMLGFIVVLLMGVQELFDKMGLASIEKSRLLGPQLQPNDFGAFLVYNITPFIGVSIIYMSKIRTWALLPMYVVYIKILITTFSRGAYLGFASASIISAYIRGKSFLVFIGILAIMVVSIFPQLIPQSIQDRLGQTRTGVHSEKMDASSADRIILWHAAVEMSLESPFFGKGFKVFQRLKAEYTERPVPVSDTHNMYLFISSQMGIPALILFLLILYKYYAMSSFLARKSKDEFIRAIGIGGSAMAVGVAVINMFGSRMVNIEVCGYFWIYLAIIMHLTYEFDNDKKMELNEKTY